MIVTRLGDRRLPVEAQITIDDDAELHLNRFKQNSQNVVPNNLATITHNFV